MTLYKEELILYLAAYLMFIFALMESQELRKLEVVQYMQALREGGSLPAIVKGDDEQLYVLKFRGAGQGSRALVAELIGGELARAMGLQVPELVLMDLDASFSQTEPDEEIQDLLSFSVGMNLGMSFLSQAITYDPLVSNTDPLTASLVVLLDSILINIDRTAKNTNLLIWENELWLIDHGAGLYFHHNWKNWEKFLGKPFPLIRDHVLLGKAEALEEAAAHIHSTIKPSVVQHIIDLIPVEWLVDESGNLHEEDMKRAYVQFLNSKLDRLEHLVKEAENAK